MLDISGNPGTRKCVFVVEMQVDRPAARPSS